MRLTLKKGHQLFVAEGDPKELSEFVETFERNEQPSLLKFTSGSGSSVIKRGRLHVSDGYPSTGEFADKLRVDKDLQRLPFELVIHRLGLPHPKGEDRARVYMRVIRAKRQLQEETSNKTMG